MKLLAFNRWEEMQPPYRKAFTFCILKKCFTFYWGKGVYHYYIGQRYCKKMALWEFLEKHYRRQK